MELNSSSTIKGMNLDNTTPQKGEGDAHWRRHARRPHRHRFG
jgi:hypothetical protein